MHVYKGVIMEKNKKVCHCCGEEIQQNDYIFIEKIWGYFSKNKDGQKHQICLCESCYDTWIQTFKYAPEIEEVTELM